MSLHHNGLARHDISEELGSTSESRARRPSLVFSDLSADEDELEHGTGDYSTQMEELFADEDIPPIAHKDGDDYEEDEEEFVYSGVDAADLSVGYRDQLRDVLEDEDDETELQEVEHSLILPESGVLPELEDERYDTHSERTSNPSLGPSAASRPRTDSPSLNTSNSRLNHPFLDPRVSRLRSYSPRTSTPSERTPPLSSASTLSLLSNLPTSPSNEKSRSLENVEERIARSDAFHWTRLNNITPEIYPPPSAKAASRLGITAGSPTVLAANGLICVGTEQGKIYIFDYKQTLKCICGKDTTSTGAVTALALSHDHTFVASGHTTGLIQLFDLKTPQSPVRTVPPTTLPVVLSGRKEGHLQGSRIVNIGFISGRHTALVSADEYGLAFYHSLGKVLFVEAADILRILGKYPEKPPDPTPPLAGISIPKRIDPALKARKTRYTVLAMAPLPLGTSPHPTDIYHVVALLTPTKLVVVGLKPTPRTWFKCPRKQGDVQSRSKLKSRGTISWFPSSLTQSESETGAEPVLVGPQLVYTFGNQVSLIHVFESKAKQQVKNSKTGKISEIEIGRIVFEDRAQFTLGDDILASQWMNVHQIAFIMANRLDIYDVRSRSVVESTDFDSTSLVSPTLSSTSNGAVPYAEAEGDIAHSVRVYKGKMFLLGRDGIQVGTLLTWADRILACVEAGDFINAIELTRSYYIGEASGNQNGLPFDATSRREVVGLKLRQLISASARYCFSEERMSDNTHMTSDGRGVDRTTLFEGLVTACCRACVSLDDFELLFEDLYQYYDDAGISSIYLRQLEPFILNNEIKSVPPYITQQLIALHDNEGNPDLVERVIWHIDPSCLDINQSISLCQRHHLYDALIYIFTRALRDYVAPIVYMLGLMRQVRQYAKSRADSSDDDGHMKEEIAGLVAGSYKLFPYLAQVLSGLSYPSEEPLDSDEALLAKKRVYNFLFFGRSCVWPEGEGEGGKLVLTADEDGGVEPTYPYARLLLQYDAEAFLHSMDIAFEDSYLNDESQGISRLIIVRILLEILSTGDLSPSDATFVNIFISRNVPKYPQFLHIAPSALHNILIALATDHTESTREDRQLAAEYLLSVYNPHESDRIVQLFKEAGFYRILRSWHRQDQTWDALLLTYTDDLDIQPSSLVHNIEDVLQVSSRQSRGVISSPVFTALQNVLPRLLDVDLLQTATLLQKYAPHLHEEVVNNLLDNADLRKFTYLRQLLGPPTSADDSVPIATNTTSSYASLENLYPTYLTLHCRFHPEEIIDVLEHLPPKFWNISIVEAHEVFDAVVWAVGKQEGPAEAIAKAQSYYTLLTNRVAEALTRQGGDTERDMSLLQSLGQAAIDVCVGDSQGGQRSQAKNGADNLWFHLLSSQVNCVQRVSNTLHEHQFEADDIRNHVLSELRDLVQRTFAALVSISSVQAVSFPRLFKRLVDSAPTSSGTHYTEFRTILTGMLESYRSEGDMLAITKHLIDRDLFDTVALATRERSKGWTATKNVCSFCSQALRREAVPGIANNTSILVSRTGLIYHTSCFRVQS